MHAADAHGNTAILYAVRGENTDFARIIVRELISKDASVVHAANNEKYTPLMYAALKSRLGVMKDLIAAGANVQAKNSEGNTALHLVAQVPREELAMTLVAALIASGASVDDQNTEGFTALMIACRYGRLELVKALLKAGADPLLINAFDCSAVDYARDGGHIGINQLFAKHKPQ